MKKHYYILGSLQMITAIGAIPAGIGYLIDTTGEGMGASIELLSNSPLKSFLLPGFGCSPQSVDNYPGSLDLIVECSSASVSVDRTDQYLPGLEDSNERTKQ